jgi:acyl carrier protein
LINTRRAGGANLRRETMGTGKVLTAAEKADVLKEIREFLAEELDVPIEKVTPEAKIIDDLGGDSMIFLELVDRFKKRFQIQVEVRIIGKYFQQHPVYTVGEVAQSVYDNVEKGEDLAKE